MAAATATEGLARSVIISAVGAGSLAELFRAATAAGLSAATLAVGHDPFAVPGPVASIFMGVPAVAAFLAVVGAGKGAGLRPPAAVVVDLAHTRPTAVGRRVHKGGEAGEDEEQGGYKTKGSHLPSILSGFARRGKRRGGPGPAPDCENRRRVIN